MAFHNQPPRAKSGAMFEAARDLRRRQTPAEARLWGLLRGGQLGPRFRRQHVIEGYVVDFCCTRQRLVIEVDGGVHDSPEAIAEDDLRSERLNHLGFRVIRFSNDIVIHDPDRVVAEIRAMLWT